ncbi:MAG: ribonuclease E/G, partial [Ilumatobacter sp.]|nr:ribonuclease E/G [Ilumatobacter sp.]
MELPERLSEGRPSAEASERGLVRKPQIGDTMPIPSSPPPGISRQPDGKNENEAPKKKRNRRGKGGGGNSGSNEEHGIPQQKSAKQRVKQGGKQGDGQRKRSRGGRGGRGKGSTQQLDEAWLEQRRGRERNGKPIGRYFMCVQSRPGMAQVAVLEGRSLIEHYVS